VSQSEVIVERIKLALTKAKASRDHLEETSRELIEKRADPGLQRTSPLASVELWNPPRVRLDRTRLEEQRIVAFALHPPAQVQFDILRAKILRAMNQNNWRSLAITAPTGGCGKTMVAVNAALSLARQDGIRVALIDLDLQRPSVGPKLGIRASASLADYIEGSSRLGDCFVEVEANCFFGLNARPLPHSADLMQGGRVGSILPTVIDALTPTVVLFDLPPVLGASDAAAFLPSVDAYILVAAGGQTTAGDIDKAEQEIADRTQLLGVVLNKAEEVVDRAYP
jgi:protein-tyrosine kinase